MEDAKYVDKEEGRLLFAAKSGSGGCVDIVLSSYLGMLKQTIAQFNDLGEDYKQVVTYLQLPGTVP